MDRPVSWKVALVSPGESEVALLASLSRNQDVDIVAVVDPDGDSVGGAIAEVMGIPVLAELSLASLRQAAYLIIPDGRPELAELGQLAEQHGLVTIGSRDFQRLLSPPPLTRRVSAKAPQAFETLERETASIHRTLSRIEEALQRESLLRWLLALATRAVGATSGSIMLYDELTEELYLAFAYGLSEATVHRTRVGLGEGIAGRVAQQISSELVRGRNEPAGERDRPDIAAAISAPLVWEERLLGVLNVNVVAGDRLLDEDDLATIDRLGRRLGLILDRFLCIQRAQTGELFRDTDRQLRELMRDSSETATVLPAWAGCLAMRLGATRLSLAVVCDDGSLLVAEGTHGGETTSRYETPHDPAWREVLASAAPLVVRQSEPTEDTSDPLTVFYLPVGKEPVQAVLTVVFGSAAAAHHFHEVSGEILYLLEKRLLELVNRAIQHDRLERLTELTTTLAEIAGQRSATSRAIQERIVATAKRLTGARSAYLVTRIQDEQVELSAAGDAAEGNWLGEVPRLLTEAQAEGWRVTLVSGSGEARLQEKCLLAAVAGKQRLTPGLLLFDKQRLHPLDGAVFTAFDGRLVGHLAALLALGEVAGVETSQDLPESSNQSARTTGEPAASTDSADEPLPALLVETRDGPDAAIPAAENTAMARMPSEVLLEALRREMDRCDRYHTAFALVAFGPAPPTAWSETELQSVVERLGAQVRSSDYLTQLPEGAILLLVPEDVQAVSRLERRLTAAICKLANLSPRSLVSGHCVYPGRYDDPARLLAATLEILQISSENS